MKKNNLWKKALRSVSMSGIFTGMSVVVLAVFAVAVILVYLQIYKREIEENAVTSSQQAVEQTRNVLENYTEDMDVLMKTILEKAGQTEPEWEKYAENLVLSRKDIAAVTIYDGDGTMKECWTEGRILKDPIETNLSYPDFTQVSQGLNITPPHVQSMFRGYYPWVVTVFDKTEDAEGQELMAAIDIRFSNISDYIDAVGIGPRGYCYITDREGRLVYHPQQQLINSGLKSVYQGPLEEGMLMKENNIYTVMPLDNCEWQVVGVCYIDEMITQKVSAALFKILILAAAMFAAVLLLGWAFSGLISVPARRLTAAMREFEDQAENFSFYPVSGTTEIAALSDSFDHMVVRIQRLMEQVRREEISLRKTELKALQAQINPHFLYNTLDAIAWMCEDGRNEEAEEMVTALARLFRISISKGHELIPIEKEVEHARSYLQIENYRYKNRFTYSFQVEEDCLSYLCNKITLQPIIENAIYHGVNQMVDEGRICIRIFRQDEDIVFQVEDNGIGMTKEQCREILKKEPSDRTGIGIKNVNDRIRIYFGEQYGLKIQSEPDVGTCVEIRMPTVTKQEEQAYEK